MQQRQPWFPGKATLAVLAFIALAALPELVPALRNYRIVEWPSVPSVLDFIPRSKPAAPLEEEEERLRPELRLQRMIVQPLNDIDHDLDHFYSALQSVERNEPGAVVRIVHYGDSPTTGDLITADVRRLLQKQFGDAGHGFCLIAKPWAWYSHRGLEISAGGWKIDPANQPEIHDGIFGLGGVSFIGPEGARSVITMREPGHTGIEIAYWKQPGGGTFQVLAEERALGEAETAGEVREPGFAAFSIPENARRFEIRVRRGHVRMFGASFTKPGRGVIYDSLGLNGAFVNVLSRTMDERHWADELRHYRPDLIIINYGTNESGYPPFVEHGYANELNGVIRRLRAAVPDSSVLIMSPMDRGRRETSGQIGTMPILPQLVSMQQQIATEGHCAFFNTFQAMGGPGTMGRWYQAEPRLVGADFIHPMPAGAKIVGNHLYRALLDGYHRYKLRGMNR